MSSTADDIYTAQALIESYPWINPSITIGCFTRHQEVMEVIIDYMEKSEERICVLEAQIKYLLEHDNQRIAVLEREMEGLKNG